LGNNINSNHFLEVLIAPVKLTPRVKYVSQFEGNSLRLQVRSDWFVYVVLCCLPWVGKELYEKKDMEMDRLLGQIEAYLK